MKVPNHIGVLVMTIGFEQSITSPSSKNAISANKRRWVIAYIYIVHKIQWIQEILLCGENIWTFWIVSTRRPIKMYQKIRHKIKIIRLEHNYTMLRQGFLQTYRNITHGFYLHKLIRQFIWNYIGHSSKSKWFQSMSS